MQKKNKVVMSSSRLWERRKRHYSYGNYVSDSNDLGRGANRLYRAVMFQDDIREERARINEVLGRLDRKSRRFAAAIVKRRMSLRQAMHAFRLETWEGEMRLDDVIAKIEAMKLEPAVRPVKRPYGFFNRGCTMLKNILRSDS